jgi:type II secretion system protein D
MQAHLGSGKRFLVLAAALALVGWGGWAAGVEPEKKDKAEPKAEKARPAPKTYEFNMSKKPWKDVLRWLADEMGVPFIGTITPTGTLNYLSPKGKTKFTLSEIMDLLNEALVEQKYLIIRRSASFTIVPSDEKIDPALLPRLTLDELSTRGDSELVSVVMPLKSLVAEDYRAEVKQMMGPFGEAVALAEANQLLLQDTVRNLKRIYSTTKDLEDKDKANSGELSYKCKYIKARVAAEMLQKLLGDPLALARAAQPQFQFGGGRGGFPQPAPAPATTSTKIRMHYITADESNNTVMVTGPANKVAQAKALLEKMDVARKGQDPIKVGPPILQTYNVKDGNAEALAKMLTGVFKPSDNLGISAIGPNKIMVYATPEDQVDIARHIEGQTAKDTGKAEVIALSSLEAEATLKVLQGMFPDSKTNNPFLAADAGRNAIIVKGSSEQIASVREHIKDLGDSGTIAKGGYRSFDLGKGSASTLADAFMRVLPDLLNNPIRVNKGEGGAKEPEKPKKKSEDSEDKSTARKQPRKQFVFQDFRGGKPVLVAQVNPRLADARDDKKEKKHGKADLPVVITPLGNRLLVQTTDPEALALIQELIRYFTTPGEGDLKPIKLEFGNAVEVAKVLDELFNGTKQNNNQQRTPFGGFGGPFGRFGGNAPTTPTENRIRVVADPQTNTLIVRASPLDELTIRKMLKEFLDTGATAIVKTHKPIKLVYARASDVGNVIKDVYRQQMDVEALDANTGGFRGFRFPFQNQSRNVDAQGNPRGVALSLGIDDKNNTIVVACSDSLFKEIKTLVDNYELVSKDARRTVRVISVRGMDPTLIQQAIDLMQGRRPLTTGTGTLNGIGIGTGTGGDMGGRFGRGGLGGPRGRNQASLDPPRRDARGDPERGRDFFADRVKDDPQPTIFFDPQQPERQTSSTSHLAEAAPAVQPEAVITAVNDQPLQRAGVSTGGPESPQAEHGGAEEQQAEPRRENIRGLKGNVTASALPELGLIIINTDSEADLEAALEIIKIIQEIGASSDVQIQIVPLDYGDATSVANTLSQLFQRVIVSTAGNTRAPLTQQTATIQQPGPGGQPGAQVQTRQQQLASVTLLPLPRLNAILLAAPKSRVEDMIREIKKLDVKTSPRGQAVSIPLKKASASQVSNLLTQFYATRYPNDVNHIRLTFDPVTNLLFVQAAPADLVEIRGLIEQIENTVSNVVNDLRIIHLNNALADELATLIQRAISAGVVVPSTTGAGNVFPTAPTPTGGGPLGGGPLGGGPLGGGPLGGGPLGGGPLGGGPLGGRTAGTPIATTTGAPTPTAAPTAAGQAGAGGKSTSLRFFSSRPDVPNVYRSGRLEDVHITPDLRTNSLIVAAPVETMPLLQALIKELDVVPAARAEINIFTLKKADATAMATMLQQLFLGTGGIGTGRTTTGGGPTAAPTATTTGTGGIRPLILTLGGYTPEGAPLIELRLTVDERTNSLIVAGSRNDLDVVEAMISRLEDSNVQNRRNQVYRLRNAVAADVAAALNDYITKAIAVDQKGNQLTPFQEIQHDVVVSFEPISNVLLISATPARYDEILHMIEQLDANPPQVVIQVLIAEVDLTGSEEFGVEVGLQSPILFSRSILPSATGLGTSGTVTITNPTSGTSLTAPGVTINTAIQPTGNPGFNFNTTAPLGNTVDAGKTNLVGVQGLGNLGVGRASSTSGIGGFVFSAASDSFNLLIRALKTQGRMDILSRPQVMALDNQTAFVQVGSKYPYITNSTIGTAGNIINTVGYQNIGIILNVTPKINPDGTVLMRVDPQVSTVAPTTVSLGTGVNAAAFNIQEVQTTVVAGDGETVAIGGLISSNDTRNENKIPVLGDLPCLGALFRFRTQTKTKTELLVILTPHIVRSRAEADRILAEESRRMDWLLGNVVKTQGVSGMEPVFGPPPAGAAAPLLDAPVVPVPSLPTLPKISNGDSLPKPRPITPPAQSQAPPTAAAEPVVPIHYTTVIPPPDNAGGTPAGPASGVNLLAGQGKESGR